jgi:hypothetical protein
VALDQVAGWRHWVKVGRRNMKLHYLLADAPGHPHPLQFEMRPGEAVPDGFRRLAPEAVEDYQTNAGLRPAAGA